MKRLVLSVALVLSAALPSAAMACSAHAGAQQAAAPSPKPELKTVSINELALLTEAKQAQPIDATTPRRAPSSASFPAPRCSPR